MIAVHTVLKTTKMYVSTLAGSRYRDPITVTILKLQKNQRIDKLKFDWWKNENGTCEKVMSKSTDTSSLGVEKVGGCFVMLLLGMGIALLISVLEFVCHAHKRATAEQVSGGLIGVARPSSVIQLSRKKQIVLAAGCIHWIVNHMLSFLFDCNANPSNG